MLPLVGRNMELGFVASQLDSAISGKGSTVLVSGEAGIGKTRLVEECIRLAESRGFKTLRGWCMHNSLVSYLPVKEALKSGELEHLISLETPPRLETVFLTTNAGLLLSKYERSKGQMDSDIFTGMLTAVTEFIKDSIRQSGLLPEENVSMLKHGSFNITAIHGKTATLVSVFTGRGNEFLLEDMEEVLSEIESEFGDKIRKWNGRIEEVEVTEKKLRALFDSEKYEGIDWARGDPKSKQTNIFENVTRGLIRAARAQPVLLFIDDLQWADTSTLSLFHYLSRNTRNSKVLILGSYRPEDIVLSTGEKEHPLTETLQLMRREDLVRNVVLKKLERDEMDELIRTSLGGLEEAPEFVEVVWRESQGNPLFALELMNLLKEEEILTEKDGKWKLTRELKSINVPSKIHDVIARRLSRLVSEQRQLLEVGAVIGEMFSSDVLERVMQMRRLELLRMLNEIEKMHRLIETMEKSYRFSHVKIRDVLYNGLSLELKREYHLIVADTMAELYGDNDETVANIGYHYYMAGNTEKAVPRLLKAIEIAKSRYSNDEIVKYCEYALGLVNEDRWKTERLSLLEDLGDVCDVMGYFDESAKAYQRVLASMSADETTARMHRKIGAILEKKGEYEKALAEFEKGKAVSGVEKTPEFGRLLGRIGTVYDFRGDFDRALSLQNDALKALSEFKGVEKDTAEALNNMGVRYWHKGEYDKALELHEKGLTIGEQQGDLRNIGISLSNIGNVFHVRGDHDRALEFYEKSRKIFEKLGDQRGIGALLNNIGGIFYAKGRYDEALEFFEKNLRIRSKQGDLRGLGLVLNNIGILYDDKVEYDRSLEYHERSLQIREKVGDQWGIGMSLNNIGNVYADRGEYDRALEFLERSLSIREKLGDLRGLASTLTNVSETLLKKGDIEGAERCANRALGITRDISIKGIEGIFLRIEGMIETEKKMWATAEEKFENAVSILQASGIMKDLAKTYLEYGKMLRRKGDMARARDRLRDAMRRYEEMNLTRRADIVKKEIDELD